MIRLVLSALALLLTSGFAPAADHDHDHAGHKH